MNIQKGGTVTLTVQIPQPNFYPTSTARLEVQDANGRPMFGRPASSTTPTSVTFTFAVEDSMLRFAADCGECAWATGWTYTVWLTQGSFSLDPPFKVLEEGAVTLSGDLPCSDCGGEDPPEDPPPPPEEDDPFGDRDPGDPPVAPPDEPLAPCLPPDFASPSPTVPTPCSGGVGGSGVVFNS